MICKGLPQLRRLWFPASRMPSTSQLSKPLSLSLLTNPSSSAPSSFSTPLTLPFRDTFPDLVAELLLCLAGLPPPRTSPDLQLASSCSSFPVSSAPQCEGGALPLSAAFCTELAQVAQTLRADDEHINRDSKIRSGGWKPYRPRSSRFSQHRLSDHSDGRVRQGCSGKWSQSEIDRKTDR